MASRQENRPRAGKGELHGRNNRTRHNIKRADRKVESNDIPDVPGRGGGGWADEGASEMPGLPSGGYRYK